MNVLVSFLVAVLFVLLIVGVIMPMNLAQNDTSEARLCQQAGIDYPKITARLADLNGGKVCYFQVQGAGFLAWVPAHVFIAGLEKSK